MARRAKSVVSAVVSACTLVMFGSVAPVSAQGTPSSAQPPRAHETKWEVEAHVGGAFGSQPTGGTPIGTFPVGESFTAASGRPSRYASTWYFGDGAALINQIAAGFGAIAVGARLTPLDPVLTTASVERQRSASFGARVSRRLTSRLSAEFSVDSHTDTVNFTNAAMKGIESTRASFAPVWDGIIATGGGFLFVNGITSSTAALVNGTKRRETAVTGAANVALLKGTRLVPYVTAGGGVSSRSGDLPSATLTGNYQFRFLGSAPLNESDVVKVHFAQKNTVAVGVFGGGVKYNLTPRQGLRVDARIQIGPNAYDTLVEARPARVLGTPTFSIPSTTTPALVFSNTSAVRSNLTGPAIDDLKTFSGSGRDIQTSLTVGYFLRFPAGPLGGAAGAASAPRAKTTAPTTHKWELEGHVGGAFGKQPTAGTPITAFPAGASFATITGRPSRYASTWYFGDGTVLINQIAAGFIGFPAATTKMAPLDPVLTSASLERRHGPDFGVRLSRRITPRFSGELNVDSAAGSVRMTRAAVDGIEAARASFTPMWNSLIATGSTLFLSPDLSSTSSLRDTTDFRHTLITGAVNVELPGTGRISPFLTAGGGAIVRSDDLPTATLEGRYQFRFLGVAPFEQSDSVTMRYGQKDSSALFLFGGGLKFALTARQGLRADVRVHISSNSVDTLVDAHPGWVQATPAFAISSATTPSLVFSNTSTTRPNLTGPEIVDLKTFTGSGKDIQTHVAVGYYVRF